MSAASLEISELTFDEYLDKLLDRFIRKNKFQLLITAAIAYGQLVIVAMNSQLF